ncbi:MAG: DUF1295 domain-containing protein [Deltaproteobacteria bacterium]|nr:DUF1295 domain-containing protein [Deltaproteobacteria bacterium]
MRDLLRAIVVLSVTLVVAAATAWAASAHSATLLGLPAPLVAAAVAFAVNLAGFVPAALLRTERFYDATGTLSFLAVLAVALAAAPSWSLPRVLPALLVAVWTLRLGSFLVARIRRASKDGRFDEIKGRPARFLVAWALQALWAQLTSLPAVMLVSAREERTLSAIELAGYALWVVGFVLELVADRQKSAHARKAPGTFITSGLWRFSRHPNYLGEIALWLGLFIAGAAIYQGPLAWIAAALSPVLVFVLLRFVSGIPLLEARADQRWGADPAYRAYRDSTSLLVPLPLLSRR